MSELKPCPFCGGEAKFVHIFENPEKCMVSCKECDGGIDAVFASEDAAAAAWNRRAQPANEPLTLDELRGMDGEPVWIVAHPDWGHWELSEDAEDYFDCRDEDFYGMTMPPSLPDPMGRYGLHVLGWLAYRRKPGGSENDA